MTNDCIAAFQLEKVGESVIADFDRRIADIPPGQCAAFGLAATGLTDQLMVIYKVVVLCVRREPDMAKVAASWQFMVKICDEFAGCLSKLKAEHPACGAETYHDRVLDLRNKCRRLQEMHMALLRQGNGGHHPTLGTVLRRFRA